jgi:hypothetical protein
MHQQNSAGGYGVMRTNTRCLVVGNVGAQRSYGGFAAEPLLARHTAQ